MPINNLSKTYVEQDMANRVIAMLTQVLTQVSENSRNLTPDERTKFGSISERNKLIVGKASDYHIEQPMLQSPDVPWDVFDNSWSSRKFYVAVENLCASIVETASDTRILHDYDLYQMVLVDYDYTKYKANSTSAGGGFTTKYEELKQFFGNPVGTNGHSQEAPDKTPL